MVNEAKHKYCFGHMDCLVTENCSKCSKEEHNACYQETFSNLIEKGEIGVYGEVIKK